MLLRFWIVSRSMLLVWEAGDKNCTRHCKSAVDNAGVVHVYIKLEGHSAKSRYLIYILIP